MGSGFFVVSEPRAVLENLPYGRLSSGPASDPPIFPVFANPVE